MHDVAWRGMWICVRSKDAKKKLARTSLRVNLLSKIKANIRLFRERFPTKPYEAMPKGIMGNGDLWYLIEALGVSAT